MNKLINEKELNFLNKQLVFNKNKISMKTDNLNNDNENLISAIIYSFNSYGYTLSVDSYKKLKFCSVNTLQDFYELSIKLMNYSKGDKKHVVFYKDFPNIENLTKLDYVLNAIVHYYTANENEYGYMPQEEGKRDELTDTIKYKEINIISLEEEKELIKEIITNYFSGRVAIPYYNHNHFIQYMLDNPNVIKPDCIPFKENLSLFIKGNNLETSLKYINTMTDLLRFYVSISNGDESLINKTIFKSLKRSERRIVIQRINELCNSYSFDELHNHQFLFKRMFEKLHVGEFAKSYPKAFDIVSKFRDNEYQTYNSKLQKAYIEGSDEIYKLLKIKPGVFARTIDSLLRSDKFDDNVTLEHFNEVTSKVSNKLLLDLWDFYLNRTKEDDRIISIKKQFGMLIKVLDDQRNKVNEDTISNLIEIIKNALTKSYSLYEPIQKVYLDESMKNYPVVKNDRNASKGKETLTFGSKVKLQSEKKVLRFFTHWKNSKYSIDIDLSMHLYDENFSLVRDLSWHNMDGGRRIGCYHSGDIITAPNGASEFIDLNLKKASKVARYAVLINDVFSGDNFCDIPECYTGVMFREKAKSGEIFETQTVEAKFNLTQNSSSMNIAFLVDLHTMQLIWIDRQMYYTQCTKVAYGNTNIVPLIKQALNNHISMYELVSLHKDRLEFVSKEEAEFIISNEQTAHLKQYDFEQWANWI